jgi:subtilase family serine protease
MRRVGWLGAVAVVLAPLAGRAEAVMAQAVPPVVARGQAVMMMPAPADQVVAFEVSLPLRNEAALDRLIARLTGPGARSRRYLSAAEFTARFGPSAADYASLRAFLEVQGLRVTATAANRRLVQVAGRVADIERVLHVRLGLYKHPTQDRLFMAPDREPTLDVSVPVLAITGLDTYDLPVSHLLRGAPVAHTTGSGPNGQFVGADMRAAYYGGTALTGAGQSVGLLELGGYNIADVQRYFSTLGQPLTVPVTGVSVNGASLNCSGSCDDSEQVLDIEESIAMAPGLANVFVYVGNAALPVLNRMASDDAALQLSSSWGWSANQAADEPVFKEFIAQGQSFVDATGDYGYHLRADGVWPADDAYVTAVGGTDLVTKGAGGPWKSETGWRDSGGGPSPDGIALPQYQAPFVTAANKGSTTLRNVPDIAAEADTDNYSCWDGGCSGGNGGTSYAAPRWAGFIALANEQAAQQGSGPVGFVNAVVYGVGANAGAYAADFHDQTSGFNGKYHDVPGFDLVTGFGSPDGQAMIDALAGR